MSFEKPQVVIRYTTLSIQSFSATPANASGKQKVGEERGYLRQAMHSSHFDECCKYKSKCKCRACEQKRPDYGVASFARA
eukprot:2067441-Pleurochrysis_carterae.AAC.1